MGTIIDTQKDAAFPSLKTYSLKKHYQKYPFESVAIFGIMTIFAPYFGQ